MADQPRVRRSDRYARTPDRVSQAAGRMNPSAEEGAARTQPTQAVPQPNRQQAIPQQPVQPVQQPMWQPQPMPQQEWGYPGQSANGSYAQEAGYGGQAAPGYAPDPGRNGLQGQEAPRTNDFGGASAHQSFRSQNTAGSRGYYQPPRESKPPVAEKKPDKRRESRPAPESAGTNRKEKPSTGAYGQPPAGPGNVRGYTGGGQPPALGPKNKGKGKSHAGLIVTLVLIAALAVGGAVTYGISRAKTRKIDEAVTPYDGVFCQNVYVDGIHLGGMTPEEGLQAVQKQIQQKRDSWKVTLTYQGNTLAEINADTLGMSVDVGKVMNDAWLRGHTGNNEERYNAMQTLAETPYHGTTALPSGDTSRIDPILAQVKAQIDTPARDAYLSAFDPSLTSPFVFVEEQVGLTLDTTDLLKDLYGKAATLTSGTVELTPDTVAPQVTKAELQKHYMLRSSVYTPISTSSTEERNMNIARAFEFVNGYVLAANSTFSFNGVVGERTEARGFYPAIEYAYGEHVEGIGGGVCQASTTLYQAAVCAGLKIEKRSPHSDAVSYSEYGRDATVYWNGKRKIDLVFRNNTNGPIYIVAAVQADPSNKKRKIAKVSIYGEDMGDVRYELVAEVTEILEPPVEPTLIKDKKAEYVTYTDQQKSVSKAQEGYVIDSYRVKYEKNTETERVHLYTDTYQPKAERIYVGVTPREE